MKDIWIIGATGRVGRTVAEALVARGITPVVVGRDRARLANVAGGKTRMVVAATIEAAIAEVAAAGPCVVFNTIGPFGHTALPIITAAPQCDYLDVCNELPPVQAVLGLHDSAVASGRTFVAGAGYGVLATESIVLKLCEGQPPANRVRVDTIPLILGDVVGEALAATIIDAFGVGGRRYEAGALVRRPAVTDAATITLPDGTTIETGGIATGDLEAAQRASGAAFVVAGSVEAPSSTFAKIVVPIVGTLLKFRAMQNFAKRRLARVKIPDPKHGREFSWSRAHVEWSNGTVREAWLRAPEGMAFTTTVATEVAFRLASGAAKPGAYTPGALFGYQLAEQCGATFVVEGTAKP